MKKLFFIFNIVCLFFLTLEQCYAKTTNTREIELRIEAEKKGIRSMFPVNAWLDGQTVYISFYDQPQAVSVIITDMDEDVFVSTTFSYPQVITIPVCKAGKYQIEIHVDSKVYTGVFELE